MKFQETTSEAIVLKSRTIGENDILVDFLTPDAGRLSGVARHGRKSRRRFGTVLEALNIVRLRYLDRGGIVSLLEASLEIPLPFLSIKLQPLIHAFYLVDLIRESVHERNPDPRLYQLLRDGIVELDEGREMVVGRFETGFLELSGYRPNLERCFRCGRPFCAEERFFFVFREGGISCPSCLPRGLAHDLLTPKGVPLILSRFIEYQLGHPLKASKFLTDRSFCD